MRITKRIVIRIIITVAVAVILSKLKLLGIMNVDAMTISTATYSDFCVYQNRTSVQCDSNLTSRNYFNRNWYTYTYQGDTNFQSVSVLVNLPNITPNKPFYLSGLFIFVGGNVATRGNPLRAYIDVANRSFTCDINFIEGYDEEVGGGQVATISCPNVVLPETSGRLFITGPFANYSSLYGFSEFVGVYDDDILSAQNITNSRLNDLKNSLSSTNSKLDELIRQQQQSNSTQNDIKNNTKETNDLIKSDNVDNASSQGSSFFNDFSSNAPQGLSGIISSPLRLITSLSSSTCSPLTFPLPFVNQNASLPCMSTIYSQFPEFYSIWQIITTGLIGYWVCVNLFRVVKGLQDPGNDRIEVLDL